MAYTTSTPPNKNRRHQVVIVVDGPVDREAWKEFVKCIKACVDGIGGGIGVRGLVDKKTGSYIYPPGTPKKKR